MRRHSAPDKLPGDEPWYRTSSAIFTAGGIGLALLIGLVVLVVQMSDDWSKPISTVLTTGPTAPPPARDKQTFVVTPSETSSSFTTSVPVSTTDIGLPTNGTSGTETTTSGTDTTTSTTTGYPTTFPPTTSTPRSQTSGEPTTTTTRKPRFNETRTLYPPP